MAGRRLLGKLALLLAGLVLALAGAELLGRSIGYDWERREQAQRAVPPFYRQPRAEVGPVFFRREGPETWTGNVLDSHFRSLYGDLAAEQADYAELPEVTLRYDEFGFRNAPDLEDWQVVVVGDSFTELGYLADEDLFTSVAAERLGVPVKNLGASFTGPATHNFYLEHYGGAPSLQHAVLAFFEGNDLLNLAAENAALARLDAGAPRPTRRIEPQSSLFRHLAKLLRAEPALLAETRSPPRPQARYLGSAAGTPVNLRYAPPTALSADDSKALNRALASFARTAKRLGAKPWLLYLPAKMRVLHGQLQFEDHARPRLWFWKPGTLKKEIAALAETHGIAFIDATPRLKREARARRLPYNARWDTHFNRHGSRIVGGVLADSLSGP